MLDVVACDEELSFSDDALIAQPGARIRRIASPTASDAEMIKYYRRVLEALPPVKRQARILAHYALVRQGIILGSTTIEQELKLVVPPSAAWIESRPLSAFHYVPRFGRTYAGLSEDERAEVDAPIGAALRSFLVGEGQRGRRVNELRQNGASRRRARWGESGESLENSSRGT